MSSPSVLLSAGSNAHGQLANGTIEDSHIFQSCIFDYNGKQLPHLPPNALSIDTIASGGNHTLLLLNVKSEGTLNDKTYEGVRRKELWGCGDGSKGQLGPHILSSQTGDATTFRRISLSDALEEAGLVGYEVKAVAASWETSFIVLAPTILDDSVNEAKTKAKQRGQCDVIVSMGADEFGDLGIGDATAGPRDRAAVTTLGRGRGNSSRRKASNRITQASTKRNQLINIVKLDHLSVSGRGLSNACISVKHLKAGQHHVVACLEVVWNDGDGIAEDVLVGWGTSRHGQLGSNQYTQANGRPLPFVNRPILIPLERPIQGATITSLALGSQHALILDSSGRVHGLGTNRKGQLQGLNKLMGLNLVARGEVGNGVEIAKSINTLGCTWNGSYFLVSDKQCGGGAMESDSTDEAPSLNQSISTRLTLVATGSNQHGQLGRGYQSSPVSLETGEHEGDSPGPARIDFSEEDLSGFSLEEFACGSEHVLTLFASKAEAITTGRYSQVWGWGWNEHGNLGKGDIHDALKPVMIWPAHVVQENTKDSMEAVGIWAGCGTSWIYCVNR